METVLNAIQEYFDKPIEQSEIFYAQARLVQERQGKLVFHSVIESQPKGEKWDLLEIDCISPELCYAHVGYFRQGKSAYIHEIITFLNVQNGWKLASVLRAETPDQYCSIFRSSEKEAEVYRDISHTLITYCDSVYNLDAEEALTVFAPDAHMLYPTDGITFADVSCTVFRDRWRGLTHPKELGIAQYTHIYHIELLNETTAVAKVGVAKLNDYFNDYLSCIKVEGKWYIAHKFTQLLWKKE